MVHCEGYDAIRYLTSRLEQEGRIAPYYHGVSRPQAVEREATHRAISHAEIVGVPIMIVHVSGREARNVGGSFANETFSGTQTLSPGCTATSTLKFFESRQLVRTSVITLVWHDNLNEFRFVQQSLTLPDGTNVPLVVTGEGKKITSNAGE